MSGSGTLDSGAWSGGAGVGWTPELSRLPCDISVALFGLLIAAQQVALDGQKRAEYFCVQHWGKLCRDGKGKALTRRPGTGTISTGV